MKRTIFSMALFTITLLVGAMISPALAQDGGGKVMVTTTVKNGVVTGWNCGCPQNGSTNAFAVDMNKMSGKFSSEEMNQFNRLLNEFERVNGVRIQSQSQTRNSRLKSDVIRSTSVGPLSGPGLQLCDFLKRFL